MTQRVIKAHKILKEIPNALFGLISDIDSANSLILNSIEMDKAIQDSIIDQIKSLENRFDEVGAAMVEKYASFQENEKLKEQLIIISKGEYEND